VDSNFIKPIITFETKCYEKDWKLLLTTPYLESQIEACNIRFEKKHLIINNVDDPNKVRRYADKAISKGIIDSFFFVSDYADKVLEKYDIKMDSFKGGYVYSISELTGIYCCTTPYLLHFSGDARMNKNSSSWIPDAIELMESRNDILAANPVWNDRYSEAEAESSFQDDEWYYGVGFSDQCYLIKKQDLDRPVYGYTHPESERYPKYGGNLFEKRIDSFMRCEEKLRITSKKCTYIHKNIPRHPLKRFVYSLKWKFL